MARLGKKSEININFDSFLDIITNCIGVLIVLAVLAMINAKYMTFIVRTPFVHTTTKIPVFFECRYNKSIPVNKDHIQTSLKAYMDEIRQNSFDYQRIMHSSDLELKDVGDKYYRVDLGKLFRENILSLVSKQEKQGETKEELKHPQSEFMQVVESIDPEKHFAFFLVRSDSYEVFRAARKLMWEKNVEVGWEPLSMGKVISFGTKGRRPTID